MDWLRAKVILILAFLGLDALLAYHVFVRQHWQPTYVALPGEAQVRAVLERRCLRLAEPLPEVGAAPPRLALRPRPAPAALVEALLPAEVRAGAAPGQSGVGRLYRWPGGRLWVSPEGWLVYAAGGGEPGPPGRLSLQDAAAQARAWLQGRDALPADLEPAGSPTYRAHRGGYELRWRQRAAQGLPLLDGGVRLVVSTAGVVELEWRLWDWQRPPAAGAAELQPATRLLWREARPGGAVAALGAVPGEDCERPRPLRVRLGYRVERPAGAPGPEARLVWRVQTEREVLDYDAVTGRRLPPAAEPGIP